MEGSIFLLNKQTKSYRLITEKYFVEVFDQSNKDGKYTARIYRIVGKNPTNVSNDRKLVREKYLDLLEKWDLIGHFYGPKNWKKYTNQDIEKMI